MALTLNLAVLVVAGLVAGTGALATYATASSTPRENTLAVAAVAPDAAPVSKAVPSPAAPAARSCDAQTWPYIDGSCIKTSADDRKVRVVTAPRASELPDSVGRPHVPAPQGLNAAPAATPPGMVSSDGVLRSPDIVVPPRKLSKREKRAEQRRERRWTSQSYQVVGDDSRPRAVTVMRPLRLDGWR